jgi:hypothetical protein
MEIVMRPRIHVATSLLALSLGFSLLSGCAYMRDRGNDALDIFDIGFTVTDKCEPDFALYADLPGRTPIGGACVEGKLFGIGDRQIGYMKYRNSSWGAIAWGSEFQGCGDFNANDTYQAREDQRNLKERPRFNTGFVNMIQNDNTPPLLPFFTCDKIIHIGYIGFLANCRPVELVDFILGWTTLDIVCDDLSNGTKVRPEKVAVWDTTETTPEFGMTSETPAKPAETPAAK